MKKPKNSWRAAELVAKFERARLDPSAFLEFAFADSRGLPLKQADVHSEIQRFLGEQNRALIELPRDHGKSVQLCGRLIWELGRNPGLRIKLVCATDALAADRSRFLRDQIANNRRVRLAFPNLLPSTPWCAEAFTVRRPAEAIGPSVASFGVGTGSTGARADLLVCDDIVDVRSLHCPGERRRVKDYFHNNLMNLLEPDGRFWGLCTPWHPDDLNSQLKSNPSYAVFRRAVGPNLEPVWPEKWPSEKLAERRAEIGEASFARGYRLITISEGEVLIRPEWVQFWNGPVPRQGLETVVIAVDPAVSTRKGADASAIVVAGRTPAGEVRILEAAAKRVRAPQLVEWIDAADRLWQPDAILFESNAAFAGIRDLMIQRTRFGPRVLGRAETRAKDSRIAALSVAVQNGRVKLIGKTQVDPTQRELFDEMTTYPFGSHDDLADACAAAVEHLLMKVEPRIWT